MDGTAHRLRHVRGEPRAGADGARERLVRPALAPRTSGGDPRGPRSSPTSTLSRAAIWASPTRTAPTPASACSSRSSAGTRGAIPPERRPDLLPRRPRAGAPPRLRLPRRRLRAGDPRAPRAGTRRASSSSSAAGAVSSPGTSSGPGTASSPPTPRPRCWLWLGRPRRARRSGCSSFPTTRCPSATRSSPSDTSSAISPTRPRSSGRSLGRGKPAARRRLRPRPLRPALRRTARATSRLEPHRRRLGNRHALRPPASRISSSARSQPFSERGRDVAARRRAPRERPRRHYGRA